MYGSDLLRRPTPVRPLSGTATNSTAPYVAANGMPDAQQQMPQQPRGNPQTFSQMRASGMARPAPPSAVPQGVRDSINGAVANPSAYGAPQAMDTFNRLNAALSERFGVQRRALDQQSARRGMFDSSLAVGQLGDLGVQQARAQTDLAGQVFDKQALGAQADRASANAQALQLGGIDQSAGQFNMQQELARVLGLGGLDLQQQAAQTQKDQFGQTMAQQNSQFGASQQLTRDQMLQQLAMFFGLPQGTDLSSVLDTTGAGYGSDGITYSPSTAYDPYAGSY